MKKPFMWLIGGLVAIIIALAIATALTKSPVEKAQDAFDKEETFVLVLGVSWCDACSLYKSEALRDYPNFSDLPLYYIELDTAFENDAELRSFFEGNGLGDPSIPTPTTIYIRNGVPGERVERRMTSNELEAFMNRNR